MSSVVYQRWFVLLLLGCSGSLQAQKMKKEDRQLEQNLQQHVRFLADDRLGGRRTGTDGETLAATYISEQFKQIGLSARGTSGYLQPFDITEGKEIKPATALSIDGKKLVVGKDYFPLAFSANVRLKAEPSIALQEPGYPWFYDLKELLEEQASNPHFDLQEAIVTSAGNIQKRGGTALFIYNTSSKADGLAFDPRDRRATSTIPIIYLGKEAAKTFLSDETASLDIDLQVEIGDKKRSGKNVIGFIDEGAPTTIVIGAHFDHLGLGEDNNSREVEKKGQVHNGADDNASGTAAMIELARMLKTKKGAKNNYLFIAFSGEELGLYGSKYFTQQPTVDLGSVNFMINLDMVGRLSDSSHSITVGGYGTTPYWGEIYAVKGKKKLYSDGLTFRFDSSGTGPSDHTSFYLKNIPVLFYFTGLHSDYHKPTDDYDKINFAGMTQVVKHLQSVIEAADRSVTKLAFTKTREQQTTTSARFSVTMGIMPDYTFSGAGVRADGVSENKPAQKAGIKSGDVILSIGDYKTNSLEAYMQALGKFKKGDRANVSYQRGSETLSTTVEF